MGDVSKNFSRKEFACNCGCGFAAVDIALLCGLQELRDIAGRGITISSGCRCEARNKKVGGASKSFHKFAMAADIVIAQATEEVKKLEPHEIHTPYLFIDYLVK